MEMIRIRGCKVGSLVLVMGVGVVVFVVFLWFAGGSGWNCCIC